MYLGGRWSDPATGVLRNVSTIWVPPQFEASGSSAHDIALVEMTEYAMPSSRSMLINRDENRPKTGSFVRLAGYGETVENKTENRGYAPQQVDIPVMGFDKCNQSYPGAVDEENEFCVGYEKGGCGAW